jgi:hypothetical protein
MAAAVAPLVPASPFAPDAFLLELFALGMDDLLQFRGLIWNVSAHRQREDHNDLHRWHNTTSSF